MTAAAISIPREKTAAAILLAGLAGGTGDIVSAILVYGFWQDMAPMRIMQSVASGWFGRASFEGGAETAAIGLATHYGISIAAAAFYVLAAQRLKILLRRPLTAGLAFGAGAWLVMNYIVIPLSAIGPRPVPPLIPLLVSFSLNFFFFGPPMAFVARGFARAKS